MKKAIKQRRPAIYEKKENIGRSRNANTLRQIRDFVLYEQEIVVENVDSNSEEEIPEERVEGL